MYRNVSFSQSWNDIFDSYSRDFFFWDQDPYFIIYSLHIYISRYLEDTYYNMGCGNHCVKLLHCCIYLSAILKINICKVWSTLSYMHPKVHLPIHAPFTRNFLDLAWREEVLSGVWQNDGNNYIDDILSKRRWCLSLPELDVLLHGFVLKASELGQSNGSAGLAASCTCHPSLLADHSSSSSSANF